ncbi:MAG TPA: transcriptional repressor [Thermodesulfobacteriota bacterium]|nr:transcriptional repressor [Thermodesulfobacteriota bacterium]
MKPTDKRKKVFDEYIAKKRLKSTRQRSIIFNEFFSYPGLHMTVEELYERVRRLSPKIGYTTIYRTLKLFKECGLAFERDFGEGRTRYEPVKFEGEHHDHLICIGCGRITEFEDERIERYSKEVARLNDFEITNHKVELYGYCSSCKR